MIKQYLLMLGVPTTLKEITSNTSKRTCTCALSDEMLTFKFCPHCGSQLFSNSIGTTYPTEKPVNDYEPYYQSFDMDNLQFGMLGIVVQESYSKTLLIKDPNLTLTETIKNQMIKDFTSSGINIENLGFHLFAISFPE